MTAEAFDPSGLAAILAVDQYPETVRWPVAPFNGPWFVFVAFLLGLGVCLHFALRGRTMRFKAWALSGIATFSVVIYTAFTFQSILNPFYPQVNLAQNLPLHFCILSAWGLIFAPLVKWSPLRAVLVFPGTVAGVLALTSPIEVYVDRPLFSLAAYGFYSVHAFNAILGTLLATLGFFRPSYKEAMKSVGYFCIVAVLIFPLDLAMRAWIDPGVNYFYEFAPENALILQLLYNVVPIPLVYVLLVMPIAFGGVLLQAALYSLAGRIVGHPIGAPPPRGGEVGLDEVEAAPQTG
ncbi:MAG: YwaF family protein [Micrococcales bacterium]|nr:YwaF family protein [Micrococcales bacterium]